MNRPTNPPVELARYATSAGERILRGQRILGVVRVSDVPADGQVVTGHTAVDTSSWLREALGGG